MALPSATKVVTTVAIVVVLLVIASRTATGRKYLGLSAPAA